MAEAYLPNPNNLPQVNHKDENKEHNYTNNLEWISAKNNVRYSQAKPVYCVELDKVFESTREAEEILGIYHSSISKVCSGKAKTAGGYHWRYVEKK